MSNKSSGHQLRGGMPGSNFKILVVDDEAVQRETLAKILSMSGFVTESAANAEECIVALEASWFDLVISDLRMPGKSGTQLAEYVAVHHPETKVIIVTAFADVDSVITSMRLGVIDYITKPVNVDALLAKVKGIKASGAAKLSTPVLRRNLKFHELKNELIGSSEKIEAIRQVISQVAHSRSTVLITGESGCGKELVARKLHSESARSKRDFLAINCGAIPETLLESELFGFRKGAFTGASSEKEGLLIKANGGTLFLDEIGELPLPLQVKLLRVLQERELFPLGATKPVKFDARIVAATNKDLLQLSEQGLFRRDLYYRLNVIEIKVPPLRERQQDILEIAQLLVSRIVGEIGCEAKSISGPALKRIASYSWPGNVRELANALERAIIISGNRAVIEPKDLPEAVQNSTHASEDCAGSPCLELDAAVKDFSRRHIEDTLKICSGDKKKAARALGVGLSSLYRKLEELNIQ